MNRTESNNGQQLSKLDMLAVQNQQREDKLVIQLHEAREKTVFLEGKLSEVNATLKTLNNVEQAEMKRLKKKVDMVNGQILNKSKTIEELELAASRYRDDLETAKLKTKRLQKTNAALTTDCAEKNATITKLFENLKESERNNEILQYEFSEICANKDMAVTEFEIRETELMDTMIEANMQIDFLNGNILAAESKFEKETERSLQELQKKEDEIMILQQQKTKENILKKESVLVPVSTVNQITESVTDKKRFQNRSIQTEDIKERCSDDKTQTKPLEIQILKKKLEVVNNKLLQETTTKNKIKNDFENCNGLIAALEKQVDLYQIEMEKLKKKIAVKNKDADNDKLLEKSKFSTDLINRLKKDLAELKVQSEILNSALESVSKIEKEEESSQSSVQIKLLKKKLEVANAQLQLQNSKKLKLGSRSETDAGFQLQLLREIQSLQKVLKETNLEKQAVTFEKMEEKRQFELEIEHLTTELKTTKNSKNEAEEKLLIYKGSIRDLKLKLHIVPYFTDNFTQTDEEKKKIKNEEWEEITGSKTLSDLERSQIQKSELEVRLLEFKKAVEILGEIAVSRGVVLDKQQWKRGVVREGIRVPKFGQLYSCAGNVWLPSGKKGSKKGRNEGTQTAGLSTPLGPIRSITPVKQPMTQRLDRGITPIKTQRLNGPTCIDVLDTGRDRWHLTDLSESFWQQYNPRRVPSPCLNTTRRMPSPLQNNVGIRHQSCLPWKNYSKDMKSGMKSGIKSDIKSGIKKGNTPFKPPRQFECGHQVP
eukprot:Platyproteum_vivax@DN5978_c0_g1_i3.p1